MQTVILSRLKTQAGKSFGRTGRISNGKNEVLLEAVENRQTHILFSCVLKTNKYHRNTFNSKYKITTWIFLFFFHFSVH